MSVRLLPLPSLPCAVPITAGALAVVLTLAGCAVSQPEHNSSHVTSTADDGLQRFYDQDIVFGPCSGFSTNDAEDLTFESSLFECGRIEVPLQYTELDGKTAQLAVLRAPARGEPIGSLVVNPGGPGPTGTYFAAAVSQLAANSPITDRFDIVGFDPRGTGASTPALDCFSDDERDDDAVVIPFIAGGELYSEDQTQKFADRCIERSGGADVVAASGTRNVARDMDILRAALGDDQLTYLGDSWGTRLGAVYAEMYPANVRAMVLDGGLNPAATWTERAPEQFASFQRSFEAMAETCTKKATCPLGTDPEETTQRFRQLLAPLRENPLPVATDPDRILSLRSALDGVLAGLYDEKSWHLIIEGLDQVAAGRGDTLLALRDSYHQRRTDGRYNNFLESTTVMYCADEERLNPEQATQMRTELLRAAPFLDIDQQRPTRDACEHWPSDDTLSFPYATKGEGLPQTMVVSVTGDPATPYADGVALADALGAGLLTVEGNKHGVALIEGNTCIDDFVADYLIAMNHPPFGARCVL